ncbi:MAG: hypothetical protein GXP37_10070 [Chloroflexi bacterium]|nr:hypothetical protein [Chloroflexota bacterium]
MSSSLYLMGWNEILARIFDGFASQRHASPPWLINPATRRKLKLDTLYHEVGIAVRFVGLQGKGQRRKSDREELEEASRDEVRREMCRLNGVQLILLQPFDPFPAEQLKTIEKALAAASRSIAHRGRFRGKAALMEQLAAARKRMAPLRKQLKQLDDLAAFAESWRDRELRQIAQVQAPRPKPASPRRRVRYRVGQTVEHERFGAGVVTDVQKDANDPTITICFVTAGERRFMASLVSDKLKVKRR